MSQRICEEGFLKFRSALYWLESRKELNMKRLSILLTVVALLSTQLTLSALRLSAQTSSADSHVAYFVGLTTRGTITVSNPGNHPATVTLRGFSAVGVQSSSDQHFELRAGGAEEMKIADLPSGTVTVRIESSASVRAYAYEQPNNGSGAGFVPPLNVAARTLTFPQVLKNDLTTK